MTKKTRTLVDVMLELDALTDDYTVQLSPDAALEFVSRADDYNAFTKEDLALFVRTVSAIIPPMDFGGDNPSNGRPHHYFLVGNAATRVIFVKVVKFYLKADIVNADFIDRLLAAGKRAHAEEYTVEKNDDRAIVLRFWWD